MFKDKQSHTDLLEAIKIEEAQRSVGRLKIFLGMAAGVGKTYAMLEEAQVLKKEQVDVVVGNIESHGRKEIEDLLTFLPQIPRKSVIYRDKEFKELDVEGIIRLHPSIVLVDELAHTNIPGAKNEKRWMDVEELLNNGISVHTTLNVQHIDSLKDRVGAIVEFTIQETVPDIVIEKAHSIQLIDLTPEELLQRVREGKVYTEGQGGIAMLHLFQKHKLIALREIAFRYVADKIDLDLRRISTTKERSREWKTREKFLVAINPTSQAQKLIRTTRRLAQQTHSSWLGVYVNTGKVLKPEEEEQLTKNLALTRSLGAEVVTIYDPDIAEGIKRVTYQRDVTQIILGRSAKGSFFPSPSLLDKLAAECGGVDLHVMRHERIASMKETWPFHIPTFRNFEYLPIIFLVGVTGAFIALALSFVGYSVIEFLFFFAFILIALIIGIITKQKMLQSKIEKKESQLKEILQSIPEQHEVDDIITSLEARLSELVKGGHKFVIKDSLGGLNFDNFFPLLGEKERSTALWAFENGREAGWGTETLSLSENLYIPLQGTQEVMGLLIFSPPDKTRIALEEKNHLENVCQKLAAFLEKQLRGV